MPVLGDEVVQLASVHPGDVLVDGTFGAGGHSALLAAGMDGAGTCIAIDRDPGALQWFERFAAAFPTLQTRFLHATYPDAFHTLAREGVSANVVILDVGVSSMQLDMPERGFSYAHDAPLDMRMDSACSVDAAHLLNSEPDHELARIFREYGEERHARRIARAIVERRAERPYERTAQLVDTVRSCVPRRTTERSGHPAKRVFQALRIAVNDELGMLDRGLDAALDLLDEDGRLLAISFHSLEDRIVKRRFEQWARSCVCPPGLPVCACDKQVQATLLTRRVVKPGPDELARNPRAASARLRAVRKVGVVAGAPVRSGR